MGKLEDIQNRPMKLKGIRKTPTLRVKRVADGAVCVIDAISMDSTRYTKLTDGENADAELAEVTAVDKAAALAAERAASAPQNSPYSRDQLATMSREGLEELPEWKRAPQGRKRAITDKGDMISLILAMRKS